MSENDKVGEKSDGKPAVLTPAASTGSTGVAKIFILTPEILQTLGLSGYTNARIASRDATNTIKFSIPIVKGVQATADQTGGTKTVITIGKLVEQSIGCTSVIKKPRGDSISVQNSNDTAESSTSLVPSSVELEQRLNGVDEEKSVTNTKVEVPTGSTPAKAKNVRRKINAVDSPRSQTRELTNKNAVETKNETETDVPGVRTSRRVAKPKKFNDFVLTENLVAYGRTANDVAASKNPQSRRSSLNSESAQSMTKISKKGSGKADRKEKPEATVVGVGDETMPKKTVEGEVPEDESSDGAKSLSPGKNCFTVPESPTTVRKKSFEKPHEKRSPKTKTIDKSLELKEKTSSKRGVEVADFKQPSSDARTSLSFREDSLVVPKSPTATSKKKIHKAYEAPNLIEKPIAKRVVEEAETALKKGIEISASERERSETKESLCTGTVFREDEQEKSLTTSTAERLIHKKETFLSTKPDPPSTSHKTEEVSSSKTNVTQSSDKKNKVRTSKSIPPRPIDNKEESGGSKSDPLRSSDKIEKIIGSKSDPSRSADKNKNASGSEPLPPNSSGQSREARGTKSDPPRSEVEREKVSGTKSDSPNSPVESEEACAPKSVLPKSPDKNAVASVSQLHSPRSPHTDEEPNSSKPDILKSLNVKEEANISRTDSPRSPDKTEDSGTKSDILRSSDENEEATVSQFSSPRSPDRKEKFRIAQFVSPRSPDEREEVGISQSPSPRSPSKSEEVSGTQPRPLISPGTKEESVVQFHSPCSLGKVDDTEYTKSGISTSPVKRQVDSELFDIQTKEDHTAKEEVEIGISQSASPRSADKKEVSISQFASATVAPTSGEVSCTQPDPLMSADVREEGSVFYFDSPCPPETIEVIGHRKPHTSTTPVETKVDSELFDIRTGEDHPANPESDVNTEIPLINETSCYIDDADFATDTSLNEASTAETTIHGIMSAETAPEKTMESPLRTYSRRGRSRKSSTLPGSSLVLETDTSMETESTVVVETPVNSSSRAKRPVRRNANVTDGKGLSDGSEDDSEKIEVKPRRRGRPPGVVTQGPGRGRGRGKGRRQTDTEYVPRAPSSSKEKPKSEETANVDNSQQPTAVAETVEAPKVGEVECGKCKERMAKKNWTKHNMMKHNNMGWLSGDSEPDFDNNVKLLRSMLVAVLKKKKSQLVCETCGAGKRSANGFISHLQFCGKTEDERQSLMMTCLICNNVMMPSSMEMHERFHRQEEKAAQEKKKLEIVSPPSSTRGKRKAAEKAATKILEFTDLVKEDEPANKKRRRTKDELIDLIEKPGRCSNPPNRWKGIWKNEIDKTGQALCRQQGCTFITDSIELMCNHYSECPFSPRLNYVCKLCLFSSPTEEAASKHVEAEHSAGKSKGNVDSDFENSGSSNSGDTESELSDTKPTSFKKDDRYQPQDYNVRFLDEEVKVDARWPFTYPPALRWTMEFECKNYRLRLFEDLPPNPMKLLEHEESLEYLPELSRSMQIRQSEARGSTPARWIHFERFEGTVTAGIPTFFAGGPVWAIAWLPIPAPMYDQAVEQFVAVSTHSTMESVYVVGKSYVGKNVVQIWNLGPLDHRKSASSRAPVLSYGVAHDKGTIWCMEWCPSGCYEDPSLLESEDSTEDSTIKKRMGLLAAACSDGCVHVFSLPFPEELGFSKNDEDSRLPIYEAKPIRTLTISTRMYDQGEQDWQCTKLNWCRELGHDTIIAGFSNGHVAMWDLTSKSPLFVTTRGETTFIDAFHHFYAHGHAISAIQMIPYGGKRFFITSSYDRMTKLWDLEDTSFPLTGMKRGISVDGAWLTHWPAYITAYDDVLTHAHTYLLSLRQPGSKIFPLLPTNSPTYSVATSDFGNSVCHGTLAGEVVVMFPNHLWSLKDMERLAYKKRWLATTVEVVDFQSEKAGSKRKESGKEYEYLPETYDGCKDRYGLVFRDKLNRTQRYSRKNRSKSTFSDKLKAVHAEQYPFASANRVSWNCNAWSYLWMCVAYQNGLVRFLNFNAVSLDNELRKLLPSHAKTMLNEARTLKSNSAGNYNTIDPSESQMDS